MFKTGGICCLLEFVNDSLVEVGWPYYCSCRDFHTVCSNRNTLPVKWDCSIRKKVSKSVNMSAACWRANNKMAMQRSVHLSVMDLFFAGLCGLCNQRLFWPKSTWHKKAAAFLMSVANLWCQLVLTPHRQIWGHTGPENIKNSHQQHSSRGGRVWWEQGSPKVERWLCVRPLVL